MDERIFMTEPAVFAVGDTYQIMVPVMRETLMWVRVGEQCFFDHANGTLRSATRIHRMSVPQKLLDEAQEYSICYRVVTERKAYHTETEDEVCVKFRFHPVPTTSSKAYLIADAHNEVRATVEAAKQFENKYGKLDFLILAGDVPVDSGRIENFNTIYEIIEQITHGTIPVVYAKGNHDMRGVYAEKIDEYSPLLNGNSYFTFRIGNIWGLVLDCGEDKPDDHAEYGHTVCCHEFRKAETEYIKYVIANADKEYNAEGVTHKIIVSHNPFSELLKAPFDIEKEIYSEWCKLLKEYVKPDVMISGHFHWLAVNEPGCEKDHLGQPCRVIVGTKPYLDENKTKHYVGTGLFYNHTGIDYVFIDDLGREYDIGHGGGKNAN